MMMFKLFVGVVLGALLSQQLSIDLSRTEEV